MAKKKAKDDRCPICSRKWTAPWCGWTHMFENKARAYAPVEAKKKGTVSRAK